MAWLVFSVELGWLVWGAGAWLVARKQIDFSISIGNNQQELCYFVKMPMTSVLNAITAFCVAVW